MFSDSESTVEGVEDSYKATKQLLGEVIKKRKPRKKIVGLLKQRSISNKQEHLRSMEKQEYINKILEAAKKRNVDKSKWKEIETLAEEQWLKIELKREQFEDKKISII